MIGSEEMFFILQKEGKYIDNVETFTLKEILDRQKFLHEYTFMNLESLSKDVKLPPRVDIKTAVPVGTIEFVQAYLKNAHGIENMNPIEVPEVLRHNKYLKRRYSIIEKNELPKSGYNFIKYVSQLKQFTYTGSIENLKYETFNTTNKLKEGLYQLSEVVNILSEYRCFILQDEIIGIQYYDGDCTVLPREQDIHLLKEMVARYTLDKTRPQAYSMDIAIIKDRGIAIIEVHSFASLGTYGLTSNSLPYCYKFGLDWYIKHNTPITKYSNYDTFKKD